MVPGKSYRPEDVLEIVWRRKWLIILPFVLVSAGTAAVVHFLPNLYRSETLIQIVPQRVPESYVRSTVTSRLEDRLQSLRQQILNRTRLERLIEDFKLYAQERKTMVMEDIVEEMRNDINLQIVKGDAFTVSYVNSDARLAMNVTEQLASMIIEENLRDREALAEGTSQFFETQLDDARRRLVEHEKKLETYRRQYAFELPSQATSNLQIIQNAQVQVQALADSISRDRDRRLLLERQIADAQTEDPVAVVPTAAASGGDPTKIEGATAAARLTIARERLALLQLRLTPGHPDVAALNRLMRTLEKEAAVAALAQPLSAGEPVPVPADVARLNRIRDTQAEIEQVDLEIARKKKEQERLSQVVEVIQARVDAAPTRESDLVALMRDYDTLRNIYTTLLTKKEDSNIAANLERRQIGEQFKVLDPARLPEKPFSPNRTRMNLMGALLGLILGVGLTALLEYRDTGLRTDDDVLAALSLPVLAVIPVMTSTIEVRLARKKKLMVAAGATAAVVLVLGVTALLWKLGAPIPLP